MCPGDDGASLADQESLPALATPHGVGCNSENPPLTPSRGEKLIPGDTSCQLLRWGEAIGCCPPTRLQACPGNRKCLYLSRPRKPPDSPQLSPQTGNGERLERGGVFISPLSPSHCDLIEDSKEKIHPAPPSPWFLGRSEQVSLEELSEGVMAGALEEGGRVDCGWGVLSGLGACLTLPRMTGEACMFVCLSVYRHLASHPRCPRSPPGLALAGTEPDFLLH